MTEHEQTIKSTVEALQALHNLQDLGADERKLRLSELKEQFRLLGLYERHNLPEPVGMETAAEQELSAVRGHLEPLALAAAGTPVSELARLAALKITEK